MKKYLMGIAVFLLLSVVAAPGASPIVDVRPIAPSEPLVAGKTGIVTIELTIPASFHINSNKPLQDYLIPTELKIEPQPHVLFGKVEFPQATVKKLDVSDSPMAVFEGTVVIRTQVIPDKTLAGSEITINGRVRSQACDDRTCYPPVWQPFSLKLPVSASEQTAAPPDSTPDEPVAVSGNAAAPAGAEKTAAVDFADKGILFIFPLVFITGLGLSLTPCVYPMIPITITYFGGQAGGRKGSLFIHSFLYVIGMATMYSVLGVTAAMTGGFFSAALQYPLVLVGIALVMVLLALSMFDVYELRMPAFLNRLAGSSHKGFGGTFLMGLTVGIIAAPCIGPFILSLLTYVGNRGNVFLGFSLFFVLAFGMGIPFLALGLFSGSIHRLPRSGAWMVWVRKIFGFVMLAMAVYFLRSLFPSALFYQMALALILLLSGIYVAWIDQVATQGKAFAFIRNAVGILFFAVALYSGVAGVQAGIETALLASAGRGSTGTVNWVPYSAGMLSQAAREEKPVFIDFYADWCGPCKELDEKTFSSPDVIGQSRKFIMLKADFTSDGDPQVKMLTEKYQIRGVPTLIFLKPDGREIESLRGIGFEPKDIFLDKMNEALKLSTK